MFVLAMGSCMVMTLLDFTLITAYIDKRELELKTGSGNITEDSFRCNELNGPDALKSQEDVPDIHHPVHA